jgi:T5SS/PEP-CTERM-associated repeat protein
MSMSRSICRSTRRSIQTTVAIVSGGLIAWAAADASAGTVTAAQSGDWSAPTTWTPNEPTAADDAFIDGGFTVDVTQPGEVAQRVDLGSASGQSGGLGIASGDLTIAGGPLPSVRVGQVAGSTGTLSMTGGTLNINGGVGDLAVGDLMVGDVGNGTMTMSGGQVNVSDEIIVGTGQSSVGNLTVSGGTLTNGTLFPPESGTGRSIIAGFGDNSSGTINVNGTGTMTIRFDVVLGLFGNGSGTLNIADQGTVNANFLFSSANATNTSTINQTGGTFNARVAAVVGQRGASTYNHSGGLLTGGTLSIADDSPNAVYNLSGAGTVNTADQILLGVFDPGVGTMNQTGGSATTNVVSVGRDGTGTYNQSAGTLTANRVYLGDFDSSNGTHRISGGTVTIAGSYNVGGALASNAPPDDVRAGDQGQALGANGTLIVRGSAATIDIAGDFLANPADKTRPGTANTSNLVFEILDATGTSLVDVVGQADLDGAVVDIDLVGFTPSLGATFPLVTAELFGATGTGTTQATGTGEGYTLLAEDVGTWALQVVPGGRGEVLQAVYQVPEPASLAVLAFGATALLRTRRSR